mmetsp:Transcript_160503/g.295806  ORF Transcript_160503/g.295806 Transcript_160503/m.295806 type:complete len:294 (+) Transcript_160503:3583-4464(+)
MARVNRSFSASRQCSCIMAPAVSWRQNLRHLRLSATSCAKMSFSSAKSSFDRILVNNFSLFSALAKSFQKSMHLDTVKASPSWILPRALDMFCALIAFLACSCASYKSASNACLAWSCASCKSAASSSWRQAMKMICMSCRLCFLRWMSAIVSANWSILAVFCALLSSDSTLGTTMIFSMCSTRGTSTIFSTCSSRGTSTIFSTCSIRGTAFLLACSTAFCISTSLSLFSLSASSATLFISSCACCSCFFTLSCSSSRRLFISSCACCSSTFNFSCWSAATERLLISSCACCS